MSRDDELHDGRPRLDLTDGAEADEDPVEARERERRRNRSALVGAITAFVVIVLTIIGVWTSIETFSSVPPGAERSAPAPAPAPAPKSP